MEEIFIRIEDYDDYYVSNLPRVLSLKRGKEYFKKQWIDKDGYYRVTLYRNGVSKNIPVHRLVAKAFIPNPDNLPEVNHKDENKLNDKLENLEWCTQKYNANYGTANERRSLKHKKKVGKFDLKGNLLQVYTGIIDLEKEGFNHSTVSAVCRGRRNQHHGYIFRYL